MVCVLVPPLPCQVYMSILVVSLSLSSPSDLPVSHSGMEFLGGQELYLLHSPLRR